MSATVSPSRFVELAYGINCAEQLPGVKAMKKCRSTRCKRDDVQCFRCSKIRRLMCVRYHVHDPVVELFRRLVFEFVFDYITYDQIISDKWLHKGKRDDAHHGRILTLVDKIKKCNTLPL